VTISVLAIQETRGADEHFQQMLREAAIARSMTEEEAEYQ